MPEQSAERGSRSEGGKGPSRSQKRGEHDFGASTLSTESTGSTGAQLLFVSTAKWTDDDRRDIEFYCLAAQFLTLAQHSNYPAQMEVLEARGAVEWGDPEDCMAARLDAMARAAAVHRVLDALDPMEVCVLIAAYGGRAAPPPVSATFGDELAPLVMAMATPLALQRQEDAPRLAADALAALTKAKVAFGRARAKARLALGRAARLAVTR